jgi:hypothetical protein
MYARRGPARKKLFVGCVALNAKASVRAAVEERSHLPRNAGSRFVGIHLDQRDKLAPGRFFGGKNTLWQCPLYPQLSGDALTIPDYVAIGVLIALGSAWQGVML